MYFHPKLHNNNATFFELRGLKTMNQEDGICMKFMDVITTNKEFHRSSITTYSLSTFLKLQQQMKLYKDDQ